MSYLPQPQTIDGTDQEMVVSDNNVQELLVEILEQLKIMNVHLGLITDNYITDFYDNEEE